MGHFSQTKFYTSQVSQKALFIPLKFYFKNKKLMARPVGSSKLNSTWRFLLLHYYCQCNWSAAAWMTGLNWSVSMNCSFFLITASFVVNSTVIVIIKRITKFFIFSNVFCSRHENLSNNGIYSGEKITDNNFWSVLILVG